MFNANRFRAAVVLIAILLAPQLRAHAADDQFTMQFNYLRKMMAMQVNQLADPLLECPTLAAADREKIEALTKAAREKADAFLKDPANQEPTQENMQRLQIKMGEISHDLGAFVSDRRDLQWLNQSQTVTLSLALQALQARPGDLLAALQSAGLDSEKLAAAKTIIDGAHDEIARMLEKLRTPPVDPHLVFGGNLAVAEKCRVALHKLNGVCTPSQLFDFQWALLHTTPVGGDMVSNILLYSAQPALVHAPRDGAYLLRGGDPKAEPQTLVTVTLKKGDPIGFKTADGATQALANDQLTPIPADTLAFWQLQK